MPPLDAIERWVRRNIRVPKKRGKGLRKLRGARDAVIARSLAFVIARKIARDGLPPHGIMRIVFLRMRVWIRQAVIRELRAG